MGYQNKNRIFSLHKKTDSKQKIGFEKAMGKFKPQQIMLRLSYQQTRRVGGDMNFTPAKFNMDREVRKKDSFLCKKN